MNFFVVIEGESLQAITLSNFSSIRRRMIAAKIHQVEIMKGDMREIGEAERTGLFVSNPRMAPLVFCKACDWNIESCKCGDDS